MLGKDKLLEYWLKCNMACLSERIDRHRGLYKNFILNECILDYIEFCNSNILISLLLDYGDTLIDIIKEELNENERF